MIEGAAPAVNDKSDDERPVRNFDRRKALENTKWNVYLDHIRTDQGVEVRNYMVVEPKIRLDGKVSGVAVLPVIDAKLILRRAYRYPLEQYFWEIPRGFVEPGETSEYSALRELSEEAGMICAPEDLRFLGSVAPEASTLAGMVDIFVALKCRPGGTRDMQEPGLGDCHVFTVNQAREMIMSNEVSESHTQIAVCRYLLAMN